MTTKYQCDICKSLFDSPTDLTRIYKQVTISDNLGYSNEYILELCYDCNDLFNKTIEGLKKK